MTDKMRGEFEAEILKNKAAFQIRRVASGEYQSGTTQELWKYWQTATELERERCAKVCDELGDYWSAYKDTALLNGDVDLSNAASGEPRAATAIAAAIRQGGDA